MQKAAARLYFKDNRGVCLSQAFGFYFLFLEKESKQRKSNVGVNAARKPLQDETMLGISDFRSACLPR